MFFLYILKETGDLETMKTELVKFLEMTGRYSDEVMKKTHGLYAWNHFLERKGKSHKSDRGR